MAHIAIFSWYPLSKQVEVSAVWNKGRENPTMLLTKGVGPYHRITPDGIETFSVFEVENAKLNDALNELGARMFKYIGIEGYRYEIRLVSAAEDMQPVADIYNKLK